MNWQIIRYADVLLWKAEALIEIGDATSLEEARECIYQEMREQTSGSVF